MEKWHGRTSGSTCSALYACVLFSLMVAASPQLRAAADGGVPTVTREKLLEAVRNAKQGNREDLAKVEQAMQRPGPLRVPKDLLPDFVALLHDEDPKVQCVGAVGLRILKDRTSLAALVQYLKRKDFRGLDKLVRAGKIDERRYDDEMQASSMAILALGEIGDKSVIPLLASLRSVKDLKFEFGGGPVQAALAKLGDDGVESLSQLGLAADARDPGERMAAQRAIRGITDPKRGPALMATVKDERCHVGIRAAALGALAGMARSGGDTLPFLVSVIRDPSYPLLLRRSVAQEMGSIKGAVVEATLRELSADPACGVRSSCLVALGNLSPERYLPEILAAVMDAATPLDDREELARGLSWAADRGGLRPYGDMLAKGIEANSPDGTPVDQVRLSMWEAYNKATGKEPLLVLRDDKVAYAKLRGMFHSKIISENTHASAGEVRRLVDERIKAIVVKWPGEEGKQKR